MITTLAWMGAAMVESPTLRAFGQRCGGVVPVKASLRRQKCHFQSKASGEPCKICNPYPQIFAESSIIPHCTRNKIALGMGGRYECYRHCPKSVAQRIWTRVSKSLD